MSLKSVFSGVTTALFQPPTPYKPNGKIKILVVEDDASKQDEWFNLLRSHDGVEVEVVSGSRAAMRKIEQGGVDILVLDWNLYSSGGKPILDAWLDYGGDSPSAIYATDASDVIRQEALATGAHNVFSRPVDPALFSRVIARYVRQVKLTKTLDAMQGRVYGLEMSVYKLKLLVAGLGGTTILFFIPAMIGYPGLLELLKGLL